MTDDALERLRAADPARTPDAVSDPHSPGAQAILRKATSVPTDLDTPPTPATEPAGPTPAPWWRRPLVPAAAAMLVLLVGIVAVVTTGDSDDTEPTEAIGLAPDGTETGDDQDLFPGDEPRTGVDPAAGGSELTSCVEQFSPETLATRSFAFDGTITAIDDETGATTFEVNEWFAGGDTPTVTKNGDAMNYSLLDPQTAFEPGTRALVSGDDEFVWTCGFTQLYDPATADQWRAAFAG